LLNSGLIEDEKIINIKFTISILEISITSRDELHYARSLLKLYETTIRPFLIKHKHNLTAKAGTFNRLFFVSGKENNDHVAGKSIHNTRRTMDLFIHYAISFIDIDKTSVPKIAHRECDLCSNKDFVVPRELAHLSHFRNFLNYDMAQRVVPFSIFHFDLNYFKCFMIPLLTES
jgi:hypothetical protein